MNISAFKIGMDFISDSLSLDRAVFYGICCSSITPAGADPKREPAKVSFFRHNRENMENFDLRADENGEVNLGHWILCENRGAIYSAVIERNQIIAIAKEKIAFAERSIQGVNLEEMIVKASVAGNLKKGLS